jgi:hypothetical protein
MVSIVLKIYTSRKICSLLPNNIDFTTTITLFFRLLSGVNIVTPPPPYNLACTIFTTPFAYI